MIYGWNKRIWKSQENKMGTRRIISRRQKVARYQIKIREPAALFSTYETRGENGSTIFVSAVESSDYPEKFIHIYVHTHTRIEEMKCNVCISESCGHY